MTTVLSRRQLLFPSAQQVDAPAADAAAAQAPTDIGPDAVPMVVPVPSAADRHILSRFSGGITPALARKSAEAGGARAWFEEQLDAGAMGADVDDPLNEWWPHLTMLPSEKTALDESGTLDRTAQGIDFARWSLIKRIQGSAQLFEVMADFWSNILYVSNAGKAFPHRPKYDSSIRRYALGRFEDLLIEAVLDPAMLCYLDNARSTKKMPNENLGRELLELHTLGRQSAYTELDVLNSTRILTGYRVVIGGTCQVYYSPEDHYVGPVQVMDFVHDNSSTDGRPCTLAYLSYLAHHEATANRIARALAVRFVSDTPSQSLVTTIATAFVDSGTDIPTTLRALVDHPEFAASAGRKIRTPIEDVVNTYRILQTTIKQPTTDDSAAIAIHAACDAMGQRPFNWTSPDGFPDNGEAWSSASRLLGSWHVHRNLSAKVFPKVGITYQPWTYWLGRMPVPFETIVDRMCRLLLCKPLTPLILDTVVTAVGVAADQMITSDHVLVKHRMPLLLLALLDTPDHMTR